MNGKKCICIVLDSVGIGALPDASRFGDEGSHTLLHVMQAGYPLPNLCAMGLANIDECRLPGKVESPKGCYGKAAERFQGKDTTGGHWEIAGLVLDKPFPTFPQGFPKPCIQEFEKRIGRQVIGNRAESGTKIIQELGDEHVRTGQSGERIFPCSRQGIPCWMYCKRQGWKPWALERSKIYLPKEG